MSAFSLLGTLKNCISIQILQKFRLKIVFLGMYKLKYYEQC